MSMASAMLYHAEENGVHILMTGDAYAVFQRAATLGGLSALQLGVASKKCVTFVDDELFEGDTAMRLLHTGGASLMEKITERYPVVNATIPRVPFARRPDHSDDEWEMECRQELEYGFGPKPTFAHELELAA